MNYTLERFETETDIDSYLKGYVDIENFLECCKECPNYGNRWACPPYDFDPIDIWSAPVTREKQSIRKPCWIPSASSMVVSVPGVTVKADMYSDLAREIPEM